MYATAVKAKEQNENRAVPIPDAQQKSSVTRGTGFVENRLKAIDKSPARPPEQEGVIQRVGDKMAVEYENVSQMDPKVREIRQGIENIYREHKAVKRRRRTELDEQFKQRTENLEERQTYMVKAIEMAFYKYHGRHIAHNLPEGMTIDEELEKRHEELVNIDLTDREKMGLLVNAKIIAEAINPHIKADLQQRNTDLAGKGKPFNRKEWNGQLRLTVKPYARHAIADPIVQGYEQDYMDSGMNRKLLTREWAAYTEKRGYFLWVTTDHDIGEVFVSKIDEQPGQEQDFHIATVYFNEKRFSKVEGAAVTLHEGTAREEKREVFRHRGSGKEYVQDAFDMYVRRYVTRALNKYDNPDDPAEGVRIEADPRKKKAANGTEVDTWANIAARIPAMTPEEIYREIQAHQRAKEAQGGSPFVSFTTTEHPIFGSSSALFEGEKGKATMDLARLSKSRTFDTHTATAMGRIHGIQRPIPKLPFKESDDFFERNSAARDAMRTRELVVAGGIPDEAVVRVNALGVEYRKGTHGKFQTPEQVALSYLPPIKPRPEAKPEKKAKGKKGKKAKETEQEETEIRLEDILLEIEEEEN